MILPVVLTPEAQAEFDAAADWYEQQAGLGLAFTDAVRDVLNRIAGLPLIISSCTRTSGERSSAAFPIPSSTDWTLIESR